MYRIVEFLSSVTKGLKQLVSPPCNERKRHTTEGVYMGCYDNDTVFSNETFAKRLLLTGEYRHISDISAIERGFESLAGIDERFQNFAQAYNAFCKLEQYGTMDSERHLSICNSLVVMFNKQYSSDDASTSKTFVQDYPKFFRVVQLMLEHNVHILIRADLYRQISFFKKSIELLKHLYFRDDFKNELRDEIRFRACKGIRYPFMVCDINNLRYYAGISMELPELDWFFDVHYPFKFPFPACRIAPGDGNWARAIQWHSTTGNAE